MKFNQFKEIENICNKYNIKNYTINTDGSIDVNGNVDLRGSGYWDYFKSDRGRPNKWTLDKIPLKFRRVTGDFDLKFNALKDLEGCPTEIGGSLYLYYNKLESLEGCPTKVNRLLIDNNNLKSLRGCPQTIDGDFNCSDNHITSLEFGPKFVGGYYGISHNPLSDPTGFPDEFPGKTKNSFLGATHHSIYWKGTPLSKLVSLLIKNNCNCSNLGCEEASGGQHIQDWKLISDVIRLINKYRVVSGNEVNLSNLDRLYYDMVDVYDIQVKKLPEEIDIEGYIFL
jgi:hypothetical protein